MAFHLGTDAQKIEYFAALAAAASMDACQPWPGALDRYGYGKLAFGRRTVKAHRLALELATCPRPDAVAAHWLSDLEPELCARSCTNVTHLEWMPAAANTLAGHGVSAQNARRSVCRNGGHPFAVKPNGSRWCPTCRTAYQRARYQRLNRPWWKLLWGLP